MDQTTTGRNLRRVCALLMLSGAACSGRSESPATSTVDSAEPGESTSETDPLPAATGGEASSGGGSGGSATSDGGAASGGAPSSGGATATGGDLSTGATASSGGTAISGPEPMGEGWAEYFPDFDYHVPPHAEEYGERYTYEDGQWHLWVEDTDMSTFPGQDSGPRSEVRVRNEYDSGQRQFQADFMVLEGAERVGIWQLFKRPYPWMIRVYDGEYVQFGNGSTIGQVPFGVWQRFYAIHDADAEMLQIYIDGELVVDEDIGGSEIDYYNKFGVYGREGMGELNEIYFRNVHYFRKD